MPNNLDTTTCPLCQKLNFCDVNNANGCWCMSTKVPQALIDKVPEQLKKESCICNDCIDKYHQQKD